MAQPTPGDVHVNRSLGNVSIAYHQASPNFVANRAGHAIPVERQSDNVVRFKKGAFYRNEMKIRAPGAESAGGGFDMDTPLVYSCPVRAYHSDIPDQTRANTDAPINQDRSHTMLVTQKAMIAREAVFATNLLDNSTASWDVKRAGVASGSYTLGTNVIKWNDLTNSNPVDDVAYYSTLVHRQSGGFRPKHAICTRPVWDVLKLHPDILSRVSGGATVVNPSIVTQQLVAQIMELDELLVMDAVYDTSNEGAASSMAFMGGNAFLIYYKPPAPAVEMPSAFYRFNWTGMFGMAPETGARIKSFRMEANASDRVEIEAAFDVKITGTDMAALFYDLL
jgi:hypothetical protein